MGKFTEFDGLLLSAIGNGAQTYSDLVGRLSRECVALSRPGSDHGRVVDRRLQALRKIGKVAYVRGRWYLTQDGCQ